MTRLRDLDMRAHLADPARRQDFVTPMFDEIAPRYDRFTRLFSFGMDAGWKRALVDVVAGACAADAPRRVLDLACGTGDLAFALARRFAAADVRGVDASPEMIALAARRARADGPRVRFEVGDMMRLPAADGSVDVVTAGYGFRNVPDHRAALREAARVLRPGGVLATLDFYRPALPVWRPLFLGYLRVAGDLVGWWWHREPKVYGYIAESIRVFTTAGGFADDCEAAGLVVTRVRTMLLGGIAIHVARRGG